jgi:hypothetical protein
LVRNENLVDLLAALSHACAMKFGGEQTIERVVKTAAIYARVSSEENTIASQTAALVEFGRKEGYDVPREWIFEDEGFIGYGLRRPVRI